MQEPKLQKQAEKSIRGRKSLGIAFTLALASCGSHNNSYGSNFQDTDTIYTNAIYSTYDNVIVIHQGYGGFVEPIIAQYEQWAAQGMTIIVDGQVISADAFGAFNETLEGQVCYTENAVFSPHASSISGRINMRGTEKLATSLIDPLEQEFRASPYFNDHVGHATITVSRLREIYPEGECSPQMRAYTRLQPNF